VVGVCRTAERRATAEDICGSISGTFQGAAVEVWMVEEVEEVHRELDAIAFLERPILGRLQVKIRCRGAKARPTLLHTRGSSAEGVPDKCEVVRVEDLRAFLTGVAGCTSNGQWPVIANVPGANQAGDGPTVITGIRERGERAAVSGGEDAVEFAAPNRGLHELVRVRELRQVVDLVHHEDIRTIDVGTTLVEPRLSLNSDGLLVEAA